MEKEQKKKKRRQDKEKQHTQLRETEFYGFDEEPSSSDDQPAITTGTLHNEEDGETSSTQGTGPDEPGDLSDDEMEISYEQSFDGRVVRLGKSFVLHGCPWIKGGEWDAVEAAWDEPDVENPLDPTMMLRNFLKQERVVFQTWRNEGFESAVCIVPQTTNHQRADSVLQFLEGMRVMRSDAVATVKRCGSEIFGLQGVDFKMQKVRNENAAIKALLEGNKFLTSTSPMDKIQPFVALGQPGPSGSQRKHQSGLAGGYLYHPCILRVRASRFWPHIPV